MVEKRDFLKVVKIPSPKKLFLVNLRSFLSTYKPFPRRGWLVSVSTLRKEYFDEKMSSLVGLKKSYKIFCKSIDFGHL